MNHVKLKQRFVRAVILFLLDMATAIAGFTFGFGLSVKNWPALIVLFLFLRFFWYVLMLATACDDAEYLNQSRELHQEIRG